MKNKFIFLDIDGVLNNARTKALISDGKLRLLKGIAEKTDAKIVLISDWRLSFLPGDHLPEKADYIRKKMDQCGLSLELVSYVHRYENREKEIRDWLAAHPCDGFVILDDQDELYEDPFFLSRLVSPNWREGLTEQQAEQAVQILGTVVRI